MKDKPVHTETKIGIDFLNISDKHPFGRPFVWSEGPVPSQRSRTNKQIKARKKGFFGRVSRKVNQLIERGRGN